MKSTTRLLILCILVVVIVASAIIVIVQNNRNNEEDSRNVTPAANTVSSQKADEQNSAGQDTSAPVSSGAGIDSKGTAGEAGPEESAGEAPASPEQAPPVSAPANLSGPVTAAVSVDINREIFPIVSMAIGNNYPNAQELLDAAANIADQFMLKGTWDGTAAEINALLKGEQLCYAALLSKDNTVTVVSDLLPNNTLIQATTRDMLRYLGMYYGDREVSLDFTTEDLRMLERTFKSMVQKIDSGIAARTDAEESGTWTFEGKTFTSRRKINATTREIGLIILNTVQETVQSPEITAFLTRFGADPQDLSLEWSIRNLESTSDDEVTAVLEAFRYSNGSGDTYTDAVFHTFTNHYEYDYDTWEAKLVSREPGDDAFMQYGNIGRDFILHFSVPSKAEFKLAADSLGRSFDASLFINQLDVGMSALKPSGRIQISGKTADNGERDGSIVVQALEQKVLALNYSIRQGEKITASFDAVGKKVFSVNDINTSEFGSQVKTKLLEVATKVNSIMPEEVTTLLPVVKKVLPSIY